MAFGSVLVEVAGPDPVGKKATSQAFFSTVDGSTTISATGVFWNCAGTILCPASVIRPFLKQDIRSRLSLCDASSFLPLVRITATTDGRHYTATVQGCFEVPEVDAEVRNLCSGSEGWSWSWKLRGPAASGDQDPHGSWIAVLACALDQPEVLDKDLEIVQHLPVQGASLSCTGSPFGSLAPSHFANCRVAGIVASKPIQGATGSIFLADMHCLPGMEGAPVLAGDGRLAGLLAQPLSHHAFDAEVAVVLSATSVASAYRAWQADQRGLRTAEPARAQEQATYIPLESQPREQHVAGVQRQATSAVDGTDAVVAVCSPSGGWASGVIVSQSGLVLTNAHALDDAREPASSSGSGTQLDSLPRKAVGRANGPRLEVLVSGAPGCFARYSAKVIYTFNSALDLAVLQIVGGQAKFCPAQLCTDTLVRGQKVFVVGHGLFNPRLQLEPLCTSGIISNVVAAALEAHADKQDVMLITSAAVYPGASGGAVLSADGCLVGLVTSNTRHAGTQRSIPKLNYSIAAQALAPVLSILLQGPFNASKLAKLDAENALLSAIWSLRAPPSVLANREGGRSQGAGRLSELLQQSGMELNQSKL